MDELGGRLPFLPSRDKTTINVEHATLVRNRISFEVKLKDNTNPEDEIWLNVVNSIGWGAELWCRDYPPCD